MIRLITDFTWDSYIERFNFNSIFNSITLKISESGWFLWEGRLFKFYFEALLCFSFSFFWANQVEEIFLLFFFTSRILKSLMTLMAVIIQEIAFSLNFSII